MECGTSGSSSRTPTSLTDVEKGTLNADALPSSPIRFEVHDTWGNKLRRWNGKIESLAGLEARGITRVLPEERHGESHLGYIQMALLWGSANLTANNMTAGLLGTLVFNLGFIDSALCSMFGAFVGSLLVAYMSIWGAQSGSRTMVVARYFMGYWPSKICVFLNIVIMVGYGTVDCIVSGQILAAVSQGSMSVVVGIVIVAFISWVVAIFGMAVFHQYERWAWVPQVMVLLILVGSAGPKFDTTLQSVGSANTINANRLTFFSLSVSVAASWTAAASDFYVYYPETTSKVKAFLMTLIGLTTSFSFVFILGCGLASGIASNADWATALNVSSGAVILAGYNGLGNFGNVCGVVIALGLIQNNIPGTYSAALGFQMLGRYPKLIPRYLWTTAVVIVYLICAVVGREQLFTIFQNFLALMGYWVSIMVCIVLEEHVIFRWKIEFDWDAWEDQTRLPKGYAAMAAFLIGWVGAIISMYQIYYVGPVAKLVGDNGADLGIWVGSAFTLLVYPPLRWFELRVVGR